MQILMRELALMLERLVQQENLIFKIDVLAVKNMDRYWVIKSPVWTEFHQDPKLSVGSFLEDWAGLQRVFEQTTRPSAIDFERLGTVLRVAYDRIHEPSISKSGEGQSVHVDIHLRSLLFLLTMLIEHFRQAGIEALEITDTDYYWVVEPPEWTDFQCEPAICVGSLIDDWAELQRALKRDVMSIVDFNRLGAVFRAVSERLGRQ